MSKTGSTCVLAIDQSFTSTGIVVFKDTDVVHCERLISDVSGDMYARAWAIANVISDLAVKYDVDFVAVEGLAFSTIGNATRDLAGLQYVVITHLRYISHINCVIVAPNHVKKVATGKGNAKKDLLFTCLPEHIKVRFQSLGVKKTTGLLDLTDAYWIGITALSHATQK